ncbi:MAG: GtrA family protein [Anaerolineae bacterium]
MSRLTELLLNNLRELQRFVKFAIVGTSGAVVDFGILNLLILGFGFSKALANTCSFSAAVVNNFTWNRLWTFPESRDRPVGPQLLQFVAVNVVGYIINQTLFLSLDQYIFSPYGTLGYNVAKAIAVIVVLFWNFSINRIWTYKGI